MNSSEDYYLIGTLVKTHGIAGEFVLRLNDLHSNVIYEMESVFIEFDGLLVPFFISEIRSKNDTSLIVKFEKIDDEEHAIEFINCKVFTPENIAADENDDFQSFSTLVGYNVVDRKEGNLGKIDTFIDLPDNPLIRVKKNKKEILIPLNEQFIEKIDHEQKKLFTNVPEGLINLYIDE